MGVPKRKVSKSRVRIRRAAWERQIPKAATRACPACGAPSQPHRVCPACGQYRGRQVLIKETEE